MFKTIWKLQKKNSSTEPYIVAHNPILSHAAAVQKYCQNDQKNKKGRIGTLFDFGWYEPITELMDDKLAAERARDFNLGWFFHLIVYGECSGTMQEIVVDRLPMFSESRIKMVKGPIDFLGINPYTYYMFAPRLKFLTQTTYVESLHEYIRWPLFLS